MAEQFSASAAFTNNAADAWGDDWGDWNENTAAAPMTADHPAQPKSLPMANSVTPNQYFHQQQPQQNHLGNQYRDGGGTGFDHHNQNYLPNYSVPSPSGYSLDGSTGHQHQAAAQSPQQQPAYGGVVNNNFYNAPPTHTPQHLQAPNQQRPATHPAASTTPQLVPTFSQTISDSFDTSAANSWNWAGADTSHRATPSTVPPPGTQVQRLKAETLSPQWSIESQVSSSDRSMEGAHREHTQSAKLRSSSANLAGPAVQEEPSVPQSSVMENLENPRSSQAQRPGSGSSSYSNIQPTPPRASSAAPAPTSSVPDRLDEVLQALSLKQDANFESGFREQAFPPPPPSIAGNSSNGGSNGGSLVNESLHNVSKATTPPLPPPPVESQPTGVAAPPPKPAAVRVAPPKVNQGPTAGAVNPFKRAGPRSHIATPGLGGSAAPSNAFFPQQHQPAPVLQPALHGDHAVDSSVPENQEILFEPRASPKREEPELLEVVQPSNDRNQYLQTGHLSEDGYNGMAAETVADGAPDTNDGRLPPPGLSRYVPGQHQQPTAAASFPEPPPGLDRMIPGTDLPANDSGFSLERQADGGEEVSDQAGPVGSASSHLLHHHHHHHHNAGGGGNRERVDMSDRNLYRVPGEDDHHQQQRVVPGLENERSTAVGGGSSSGPLPPVAPQAPPMQVPSTASVPTVPREEQRELVMEGANPDDRREEPLEGGNGGSGSEDVGSGPTGSVTVEPDANRSEPHEASRHVEPSNTSTGEESDKAIGGGGGNSGFYSKGRREEDSVRRSNKSKSSRDRYDTEDSEYSDRERRRRERETSVAGGSGGGGGSGVAALGPQQRGERLRARGGERDKDKRKDAGHDRERDRDRDRDRDYDYRDRERNRYERGDRGDRYGRSNKYDRDTRYETDGSKYETERSSARYDKDDTKQQRYGPRDPRDDYYRKRGDDRAAGGPGDDGRGHRGADRAESDRRLRKDKAERSDRYRGGEERRKDDRYREAVGDKRRDRHDRRYPDPEDYRAGSRNGTERDRVRERDDRKEKDRKYLAGASGAGGYGVPVGGGGSAYGASGGYYDPYSYYAQHQQYYEQLRRTNPQAYAEWYRTYYAQMQASQMQRDLLTSDGRESVHSGRSSTNDKERFNRTTPFMHGTGLYNPEDYHRHFNNQSLPSAHAAAAAGGTAASGHLSLLDQSYNMSEVAGQPSSLPPMFHQQAYQQHHHPAQLLHQQTFQQQQQRASTSLALNRTYHGETGGSYFQPRIDQIDASAIKSEHTTELSVMEPERLTPRKFPEIHPIVSLSAGLLISTKNRLTVNGMADTVKIFTLGYSDASRKLFHTYPGPLVKGVTHKKSVIEFCEDQLRLGPPYSGALALIKSRGNSINSLHSSSLAAGVNRSSFALLWNYIILLLRQNGTFVGTDISELLMQNKEEYPFESIHTSAARSANISGRNSSLSVAELREADAREGAASDAGEDSPATVDGRELVPEAAPPKTLSELEITDKFRSYLIYGNISEALEWATEHNLWGHALFLASKVDSRQHANVMMKFANKLTLNDPLQTLYQLLSGRTPASVTSVLDEKWGDWRPHLAMLMSNSSAKPELIKKSITTLGDTLFHRGDLYAAHFCYLLSDVAFGRFADVKHGDVGGGVGAGFNNANAVRLVLLGASHYQRNFRELSTNESIMMTEIYEYARSLNEDRYSITELQRYKYLLACRMLDQGMQLKCLLYMEQIADQIQHDPYRFETEFVRKVYTLGDRLKYYDPVMEKALDESVDNTGRGNVYAAVEDPDWLKRLQEIILSNSNSPSASATNYNGNAQEAAYDYGNHHYGYGAEQAATNSGYAAEAQEAPAYAAAAVDATDINKQFNEINHQLGQLNLQYNEQQQQYQQQQQQQQTAPGAMTSYDQGYESINPPSMMEPSYDQAPQQQHQLQSQDNNGYEQQQFNQHYNYEQQQPGDGTMFTPAPVPGPDPSVPTSYDGPYWGAAGNSEQQQQPARTVPPQHNSWHHHHEEEPEPEEEDEDEDHPPQQQHRRMSDRSSSSPSPPNVRNGPTPHSDQFQTGRGEVHLRQQQHASETVFDYHQHAEAALEASAPKPTISMPNSVSNRSGFNDETDDERPGGGQGQRGTAGPGTGGAKPGQPNHNASQTKQMPAPKGAKTGAGPGAQGSGWFGGIWNKLSMKPKNQMILPDDKNPKIVWDEVSKRWVNTDENEVETEAYKPPPKMADLIPSAAAPPGPSAPQPSGPMMPAQNSGPTYQPMAPNTIGTANVQTPTAAPVTVQSNPAPGGAGEPTKVPTLQSNMYKMQRNRTLKRSYVDVFNPSGAAPSRPTEPVLAPSVPTLPNAQGGFFVPGGTEAGGQQQSNDPSEGMPQFYNPNQFAGGGGYQQRQ